MFSAHDTKCEMRGSLIASVDCKIINFSCFHFCHCTVHVLLGGVGIEFSVHLKKKEKKGCVGDGDTVCRACR